MHKGESAIVQQYIHIQLALIENSDMIIIIIKLRAVAPHDVQVTVPINKQFFT